MHEHLKELRRRFPALEWHKDGASRTMWADCGMQTITVRLTGMSWRAEAWEQQATSIQCPGDAVEYLVDSVKQQAGDMMDWSLAVGKGDA